MRMFPVTALAILLLSLSCGGADQHVVGGPCSYSSTPGTSTITELKTVADGVEAHFTFVPTDPAAPARTMDTDNHLVISTGLPSQPWLDAQNITVGTKLPTSRQEILTGTCTPLIYNFTTLPDYAHGM